VQITGTDERRAYYRFVVRPWLWLITKSCDSRIFQSVSVVGITDQVLTAYPFPIEKRLGEVGFMRGYPKRDYVRHMPVAARRGRSCAAVVRVRQWASLAGAGRTDLRRRLVSAVCARRVEQHERRPVRINVMNRRKIALIEAG